MLEFSESYITSIKLFFEKNSKILFSISELNGDLIYANPTFLKFSKIDLDITSKFNFLKHENIFKEQLQSTKLAKAKEFQKEIHFNLQLENELIRFILSTHFDEMNSLHFFTLVGIICENQEESNLEMRSTISSLNKQNSDLLELIEQLSLKNIELTKRNDEYKEELENKDKFFSILSHDLRGQIGNMINSSDLLLNSFDDLDFTDIRSILLMLNRSIHKNYSILDNLLLWASLEREKIELNPREFSIKNLINSVIENLKSEISKKKIVLNVEIRSDLQVLGDPKYIEIVMKNILSNAIKFSHKEQTIEISSKLKENLLSEIIISDSGIGMDSETKENLFKIDKIHSNYGTEKETGTGLGLLISQKIVNAHNGELNIMTSENGGTSVSILLKTVKYET